MARTALFLDPQMQWAAEPGASFAYTGAEILRQTIEQWKKASNGATEPDTGFWVPPGSDALMTRPLQMRADWLNDARMANHVLRAEHYLSFNADQPMTEWQPARKPDGTTYLFDYWQTIQSVTTAPAGLIFSRTALQEAAGVTLPATLTDAWYALDTPRGDTLPTGGQSFYPYLQTLLYPAPDQPQVFLFSNLAFIIYPHRVILLRRDGYGDTGTFTHLGQWDGGFQGAPRKVFAGFQASGSMMQGTIQPIMARVMVLPYWDQQHVYVWFGQGEPVAVRVCGKDEPENYLPGTGAWTFAAVPGAKLNWQLQLVGFNAADTDDYVLPSGGPSADLYPAIFDFGLNYGLDGGPTIEPGFLAQGDLYSDPSNPGALSVTLTQNEADFQNTETSAQLLVQLRDPATGNLWASDGTLTKGNLRVEMTPDLIGPTNQYRPVFLRWVHFRFPTLLENRAHSLLVLPDTQFKGWQVETELPDQAQGQKPEKRGWVDLWDVGVARLVASSLDARECYAIQVREDTGGDGGYATLRAVIWVDHPDLEEHKAVIDGNPIQFYRLHGRAVLSRLDNPWFYQPVLVDPNGSGHIEHSFAVQVCLDEAGFDSTDPGQVFIQPDPQSGTAAAWLPGDWDQQVNAPGVHVKTVWGPEVDETKLDYCCRIGESFSGWTLYENLAGKALYHTDLMLELDAGLSYFVSAVIYASRAEADLAGAPSAQVYRPAARRVIRPVQANVIKLYGQDGDGALTDVVLKRDQAGYGADVSYENFLGEPRTKVFKPALAVSHDIMAAMADTLLRIHKRKKQLWTIEVPMAVWDLQLESGVLNPVDVGYVVRLQGRGDFRVMHCEVEEVTRHYRTSRLTLEKVPSAAVLASGDEVYPGRTLGDS